MSRAHVYTETGVFVNEECSSLLWYTDWFRDAIRKMQEFGFVLAFSFCVLQNSPYTLLSPHMSYVNHAKFWSIFQKSASRPKILWTAKTVRPADGPQYY